jgi:hypothetical protein
VQEPEPDVIRAAMAGDPAAFGWLVRCYQALLAIAASLEPA